jgi:tetratricopeptide (TPR) repeat protein
LEAPFQIFLSYARSDATKVQEIYRRLSAAGFKPWMDSNDILPGESFDFSIRKAIRRSHFFLACLSAHSVNRRGFIQKEIRLALEMWHEKLDSDIYLIPVRLEPCEAPYSLSSFQWVDLFGEAKEENWAALFEALREGAMRLAPSRESDNGSSSSETYRNENSSLEESEVAQTGSNPAESDPDPNAGRIRSLNVPNNLPPRYEFIGRTAETRKVIDALRVRSPIIVVEGMSGIGKTSLVLQAAYESLNASRERSPSSTPTFKAFVWTSARSRPLVLRDVLDSIARTLNKPYILNLPGAEKHDEILRLMRSVEMLLLVDNFESISDVSVGDFLNNLPEPSKCLVTTRTLALLNSFPNARRITLHGMKSDESYELLRLEFGRAGIVLPEIENDELVETLIEATGGSPLAIQWSVGQMTNKSLEIEAVIANLKDAAGELFETLFGKSWSLLSDFGQKLLMLMSLLTSASKQAIDAASDCHGHELQEAIAQVTSMRLVESNNKIAESELRFTIHPLTRAYVATKIAAFPSFSSESYERLHRFYVSLLEKSDETADTGFDAINADKNFGVIDLELENIENVAEWNLEHGRLQQFIETVDALSAYLDNRGYVRKAVDYGLKAVAAAKKLNDRQALASSLGFRVAWFLHSQGEHAKAESYATESLRLYEELGDRFKVGTIMSLCGFIAEELGKTERALQLLKTAVEILPEFSSRPYQLGHIEMIQGHLDRIQQNAESALAHYRNALSIFENSGRVMGVVTALGELIRTEIENGLNDEVLSDSLSLLNKCCRLRRTKNFAHALLSLALVHEIKGDLDRAKTLAKDALVIFQWVGDQRRRNEFNQILGPEFVESSTFSPDDVDRIVQRRCLEFTGIATSRVLTNDA